MSVCVSVLGICVCRPVCIRSPVCGPWVAQIVIFPGEHRHKEHCFFKPIKEHSEPLESVQQGAHSPRLGCQGTEPCPKAPGWGPMLNGLREHTRRSWSFFFNGHWLLWMIGQREGWGVNMCNSLLSSLTSGRQTFPGTVELIKTIPNLNIWMSGRWYNVVIVLLEK